jgi:hypothetical protein
LKSYAQLTGRVSLGTLSADFLYELVITWTDLPRRSALSSKNPVSGHHRATTAFCVLHSHYKVPIDAFKQVTSIASVDGESLERRIVPWCRTRARAAYPSRAAGGWN